MIGMQGLAEAAKDPALLAQLVRDMQVRFDVVEICYTIQPQLHA